MIIITVITSYTFEKKKKEKGREKWKKKNILFIFLYSFYCYIYFNLKNKYDEVKKIGGKREKGRMKEKGLKRKLLYWITIKSNI